MDSHSAREKPTRSTQRKGNVIVLNHHTGRCGENRLWVEVGTGPNKEPDMGTSQSSRSEGRGLSLGRRSREKQLSDSEEILKVEPAGLTGRLDTRFKRKKRPKLRK